MEGIDGPRIGLHVCRGNWSRDESVLLAGDYAPLTDTFVAMGVDQFVLEHSTPRAGEIDVVGRALGGREIVVGRVEEALPFFAPERIFLNPDCGFGCFANRCVNDAETAAAKTRSMAEAARILRSRHG